MINDELKQKEHQLTAIIKNLDSLIVAYSGGVDSSLLAYYAHKELQERALIVIAVSPSLASDELDAARLQAKSMGWNLLEITTNETEKPEYQRNDAMRCYFCKSTLFEELSKLATARNIKHVAYGANMDDLSDFRPGQKAAYEHAVLSPLQKAGLTKDDIRALAHHYNLPSWNRPQAACLSSRFPTFQPVTITSLSQVEKAEQHLHSLGFKQVRVRHHDDLARIEIDADELDKIASNPIIMQDISQALKKLGYKFVTLDLEGYRQGSSNRLVATSSQSGKSNG